MNKKQILEYLVTIIITLIIVLCVVVFSVISIKNHAKIEYLKSPNAKEKVDETKIFIQMIAKYEKESMKNPTDYKLHSKLGGLYERIGDNKDAKKNYEKAMLLAPYGVYSTYFDLADFYIKTGHLVQAEETINNIRNKKNKIVQTAKGDFYINLGDAYYDFEDYESALSAYQKALDLYKYSNKKGRVYYASSKILESYDGLANRHIEEKKLNSAIAFLEKSLAYQNASFVNYKLSILYKDINPVKAYQYMRKTYETDPGLINYNIYEKIIIENLNYYEKAGNHAEAELFKDKLKLIRKFKENYLIAEDDFSIKIVSAEIKRDFFGEGKTAVLKFQIVNNSHCDARAIYMQIDAQYNGENQTAMKQRFFSKNEPLTVMSKSPEITVKYKFKDPITTSYTDKITFDFYITKKEKVRKLKIYSYDLQK